MIYNNKLKMLRLNSNLTQENIANILNIDRATYAQYESEYFIIPIKHLNSLCNYFEISLDYIFDLNSIKQYNNTKPSINTKLSSERLKEFRKEKKITQNKLSDILKIQQQTISKYEKGKNIIATPYLYTICKKYNISADYLLGKIDEPKYLK